MSEAALPARHFTDDEFERRLSATLRAAQERGLDALLLFKPESHYWLTGYDTFGHCFFQCLLLEADGRTALLTRSADLLQARATASIDEVRVWRDEEGADPVAGLADLLAERGLANARLGVEWHTHALNAAHGMALKDALGGAKLADASWLVSELRQVKSPAEQAYLREAGRSADAALQAAEALARPGADEGAILAAMQSAVFKRGGDYPANPFVIGSGPFANLCRYRSGRRALEAGDGLTLEWAGVCRHYHAPAMRTLLLGEASPKRRDAEKAAGEALLACEERLRPGVSLGEVYRAHALTLDRLGYGHAKLNACGYSVGAVFPPSWMDWPYMFFEGNCAVIEPGTSFFLHMILADPDGGAATSLGRTSIVGERGAEPINLVASA